MTREEKQKNVRDNLIAFHLRTNGAIPINIEQYVTELMNAFEPEEVCQQSS